MRIELILFTFVLAAANYFGQLWDVQDKRVLTQLRSMAAGLSTAYVFVILLPELLVDSETAVEVLLLPVLVGFTFFHVVLKYVTVISKKKSRLWNERVHLLILVTANFGTAYVAVKLLQENLKEGVILIVILAIHTLLTDIVGSKMAEETKFERKVWRFLDILSPILGGAVATLRTLPVFKEFLFAGTIGAIIYISLHEEIPHDRLGRPIFFALGVLIVVLLAFGIT